MAAAWSAARGQWGRRRYPQTGHVATPVVASTSRKLAQPFVWQYGRRAADARRRSRRIELERPATAEVIIRLVIWFFGFFLPRCAGAIAPGVAAAGRSTARIRGRSVDLSPGDA